MSTKTVNLLSISHCKGGFYMSVGLVVMNIAVISLSVCATLYVTL